MTSGNEQDTWNLGGIWASPVYAEESLEKVTRAYVDYLEQRSQPAAPGTVAKYRSTLLSLTRSLERQKLPLVLGAITPAAVNTWVREQRAAHITEHTIASRLAAVKVFTHKYLFRHLELTVADPLYKVAAIVPPEKLAQALTQDEIDTLLNALDGPTFEDIRNRAMVVFYIATGLRFSEVLGLPLGSLDRITGEVKYIRAKGNKERFAWLSPRAMKYVKAYLRARPSTGDDQPLWLKAEGTSLTYHGAHSIMRRLRDRSGIARLHWHLFRHGFAQTALHKGADIGTVQEMLGHSSVTMTRRYAGRVRQIVAARQMPKYSPI